MLRLYSSHTYKNLPFSLQNALVTGKGIVYSKIRRDKKFYSLQKELLENEELSSNELNSLQLARLKGLLTQANKYVPYYNKLFDSLGFQPHQIKCITDLTKLPLLDKQTVRHQRDEFLASNANSKFLFKGSSSGSTGTPLSLFMDRNTIRQEHAFVWRQFRWAGCQLNCRIATFRGDMIASVDQVKPPFWRYDVYNRELWFSSYHLSEDTVESYLNKLIEFDPNLIYAYPSSLFILGRFVKILFGKISIPSLKGIVTSSETLYEYQKKLIEETFSTRVFDWYGLFERVIFIGTCEYGNYHIFPEYGITEYIPLSENNVETYYELVGTGFINTVMPLIRYRTGDVVTLSKAPCECGRAFPRIKSVLGRLDDIVKTTEGRFIGRLDHIFKGVDHVHLAQIFQEDLENITILLVPEEGYSARDEEQILRNAANRLGNKVNIKIKSVNEISRSSSGKFKAVISNVRS
jgi:phenylacetate-CoA ligase